MVGLIDMPMELLTEIGTRVSLLPTSLDDYFNVDIYH
jgi:hypothetical protein